MANISTHIAAIVRHSSRTGHRTRRNIAIGSNSNPAIANRTAALRIGGTWLTSTLIAAHVDPHIRHKQPYTAIREALI